MSRPSAVMLPLEAQEAAWRRLWNRLLEPIGSGADGELQLVVQAEAPLQLVDLGAPGIGEADECHRSNSACSEAETMFPLPSEFDPAPIEANAALNETGPAFVARP